MSGHTLTQEQKTALKGAFEDIDITKTGNISKSELRATLQLIGQNPTAEEMASYMDGVEDGEFTLGEFFDFIEQKIPVKSPEDVDKELMDAFEKFNDDKDFLISKEEFKKIMTKLGDEPLTDTDADTLLDSLTDIEHEGRFNVAELAKLFTG